MCDYVIRISVNGEVKRERITSTISDYTRNYLHKNRIVITSTFLGYPYVVLISNPAYDLQYKNSIASNICNCNIFGTAIVLKMLEVAGKNELVPLTEDEVEILLFHCLWKGLL